MQKKKFAALESEKTLLGALLIDSSLLHEVYHHISIDDFYKKTHRDIYARICFLHGRFGVVDIAMVRDALDYDMRKDIEYLYELADECASTQNIKAHAEIIREKAVQRNLFNISHDVIEKLIPPVRANLADYLEKLAREIRAMEVDKHLLLERMFDCSSAFVNAITAFGFEEK